MSLMFYVFTKKNIIVETPVREQEIFNQTKTLEEAGFSVNQGKSYSGYIAFSCNENLTQKKHRFREGCKVRREREGGGGFPSLRTNFVF